jgi:hypothetical protein
LKSTAMKESWRAVCVSDEDEKENAWDETFRHAEHHDQSDVDILKSKTTKEDWRAWDASDEDEKENAWDETFRHADQLDQSCTYLKVLRQ